MNIYNSWIVKTPIAHRGLHNESVPENSISAFKKAIECGYAIEFDVHPLKSGEVVVFHDNTLDRMVGVPGKIEEKNLNEIKHLKLKNSNEQFQLLKKF